MFDFLQSLKNFKRNTKNDISTPKNDIQNRNDFIDQDTLDAMERSEQAYQKHLKNINNFDYKNINLLNADLSALSSVEKSFLQYIANKEIINIYIAGYWTHEYNIDYKKTITKFIAQNYISITNVTDNLSALKVTELKEILSKAKLPKTGKKQDLINRLEKNLSKTQLQEYVDIERPIFYLTDKGKELLKNFPKSATKDIDFEDQCLYYIEKGDFNAAYKIVCQWESKKPMSRGINMDWHREYQKGLSASALSMYQKIFNTIPESLEVKSAMILAHMLGVGSDKTMLLIKRVTDNEPSPDTAQHFTNYFYNG